MSDVSAPRTPEDVFLPVCHGTRRSSGEAILLHGFRPTSVAEQVAAVAQKYELPLEFLNARIYKIKPSDVEGLILAMRAKTKPGKRTEKNPDPAAGPSTVGRDDSAEYTVLRTGLDGAVRDGLLAKNPAPA